MLEADWTSLITPEIERAFREMWAMSKEEAEVEAKQIIAALAEFDSEKEDRADKKAFVSDVVAKIVLGLVGERPDAHSWFEAIANGSFELRPEQDYAHSTQLKSRARLLKRQQKNLDSIDALRRAWASDVDVNQDAVRLIAASALLKELRKNVAAKAALGPAWPLMVAVNDHFSAQEKRHLHHFGSDKGLIKALAAGSRLALKRFLRSRDVKELPSDRGPADWRRELPPGTDPRAYFVKQGVSSAEKRTLADVEAAILKGPRPSFIDHAECINVAPTKVLVMMMRELSPVNHVSKVMRALAREKEREALVSAGSPLVDGEDFRLQVWLKDWARQGLPCPPRLPARLFCYLEEEVSLAYETYNIHWDAVWDWDHAIPALTGASVIGELLADDATFTWCDPPRKIDRIQI